MSKKPGNIGIASDHAGFHLKTLVIEHLRQAGHAVDDLGCPDDSRVDYPDYGYALAKAVAEGKVQTGIGICGSGIGISIALNRVPAVRAALCHDVTSARLARRHNDANVLALGARLMGADVALECVDIFLSTEFEGGRHAGRVEKLGCGPEGCGAK